MHRIDVVDSVSEMPAPAAVGQPGFYSDGDVATGRRGTPLSADALNAIQEELAGVIEYTGRDLDKSDNGQLLAAIREMFEDTRVGEVFFWPFDTEPDGRAMRCFGQEVPRTGQTAKLFQKAGTKYGAGDGVTTFKLPDPRNVFIRVWDDRLAELIGRLQSDQNKAHAHTATTEAAGAQVATQTGDAGAQAATSTGSAGGHAHTVDVPPAATDPDVQGADAGNSFLDLTKFEAKTTSAAPDHTHSIPAVPDHHHSIPAVPDHSHTVTVDSAGGDEARPVNIAWPLYIRY